VVAAAPDAWSSCALTESLLDQKPNLDLQH
jgi:hypothetical protein